MHLGAALVVASTGLSAVDVQAQTQPKPAPKPAVKKTAPAAAASQKGVIIVEEATVFKDPDFDADVIASVQGGQVFDMSVETKGPFYKVRLKPGTLGWISDAEIKPVSAAAIARAKQQATEPKKLEMKDDALADESRLARDRRKPLHGRRFRGLGLEMINYAEDTMGGVQRDSLLFYGMRWSGNNTMFSGEMFTDAEILFHSGAPGYYQEATRAAANGFIMISNFLFISEIPQTRDVMAFYGFGPTFKFSQFNLQLLNDPTPGRTRAYQVTDATIGAVFAAGVGFGIGDRYAVRLDGRYYWETQRYTSFSLAFQMDF